MRVRPFAALAAAAVCLACVVPASAKPQHRSAKAEKSEKGHMVLRTYEVADLAITLKDTELSGSVSVPFVVTSNRKTEDQAEGGPTPAVCDCTGKACSAPASADNTAAATAERLMKMITAAVAPQSWSENGGEGMMEFYPLGFALVVKQTPEVHERIAELLTNLRRLQDTQVAVDVRFLTVPDGFLNHLPKIDPCRAAVTESQQGAILNDQQVFQLLEAAQADRRTDLMQAPKVTVANGQAASLDMTDAQTFVTGVDTVRNGGSFAMSPKNETIRTGLRLAVQPAVSADRRSVLMNLKVSQTNIDSVPVPLFPVATMMTPVYEGGAQGKPIPFVQFLQQPKVNTFAVNKTLTVADRGTMILSAGKSVYQTTTPCGLPGLRELPFVGCLFETEKHENHTAHHFVLVTPRIIIQEEEEKIQVTQPESRSIAVLAAQSLPGWTEEQEGSGDSRNPCEGLASAACQEASRRHVAGFLRKYEKACAEGRLAEAEGFARQALAIDPACFSKKQK